MLITMLALTLAALVACAPQAHVSGTAHPNSPVPLAFGPPFPVDRKSSAQSDLQQNGKDAVQRSSAATESGNSLVLPASATDVESAVYEFTSLEASALDLVSAQVVFTAGSTDEAWIGFANFSTGQWDLSGPFNASQTVTADSAVNFSPNSNVYIAIVCAPSHHAQVDLISLTINSRGWTVASPDPGPNIGAPAGNSSLAVVDGKPAISYFDHDIGSLVYVRASDPEGSAWGTPNPLDSSTDVGSTSLAVLKNGFPAISYYDNTNGGALHYVRATNIDGSGAWGTPRTLDRVGVVGGFTSLVVLQDGKPAISYYDGTNGHLKYANSIDEDGINFPWGTQAVDSAGDVGRFTSLAVVDGFPAISYYDFTHGALKYVRATDVDGDFPNWGIPQTVDSGGVGRDTSLAVVNGLPAISYYDFTNGDLKFAVANDQDGNGTWDIQTVDNSGSLGGAPVGAGTSLAIVNGFPAISYYELAFDSPPSLPLSAELKYVQSRDIHGSDWFSFPPEALVDLGDLDLKPSLAEVNGKPAISYYVGGSGSGSVKYIYEH